MVWECHYCHHPLSIEVQSRNRMCPNCGSDIHACRNCHHYDENLSSKCQEPNSPWIRDRSSVNTCPYFEFRVISSAGTTPREEGFLSEAEKAKEAFKALFRNA